MDFKPLLSRVVGVIGIGNIGTSAAEGLHRAGYSVLIHDKYDKKQRGVSKPRLAWCDDPCDLARRCDVLLTCLPAPPDVRVLMEEQGVLNALRRGSVWIAHESTIPEESEYFGAQSNARGIRMLEAPLTGGIELIRQFKMTVSLGGPTSLVEEMKPLLENYTMCILHMGEVYGVASTVKIISNMLCAVHTVVSGEAMMIAKRAGVNHRSFFEAIRASAGNSFVFETEVPLAFNQTFDPHFTLKLHCKDLAIGDRIARKYGVPIEVFGLVEQIYNRARLRCEHRVTVVNIENVQ